jgi:hypothetical protein
MMARAAASGPHHRSRRDLLADLRGIYKYIYIYVYRYVECSWHITAEHYREHILHTRKFSTHKLKPLTSQAITGSTLITKSHRDARGECLADVLHDACAAWMTFSKVSG